MLAVAFLAFLTFRFVGDPVELMLNEQASQAQRATSCA
jgi:peptide/nickel transport system permease protein